MNVRTTIMLDKPILEKIRRQAREGRQTLRETIRNLLLAGMAKTQKKKNPPFSLPTFDMGREKIDISNRTRLYEILEERE